MLKRKSLKKQKGVVLFVALIALIAMMAAAIALSNTAETGAQLSTNRYFALSAQSSADVGYAIMKDKILSKLEGKSLKSKEAADILLTAKAIDCYLPFAFFSSQARSSLSANVVEEGIPVPLMVSDPTNKNNEHVKKLAQYYDPSCSNKSNCKCSFYNEKTLETVYFIADLQCSDATRNGFTETCIFPNNVINPAGLDKKPAYDIGTLLVKNKNGKLTYEVGKVTDNAVHAKNAYSIGWQGYGNEKVPSFALPLIRISVRVDGPRGTRVYRQQMVSLFQNPAKTN